MTTDKKADPDAPPSYDASVLDATVQPHSTAIPSAPPASLQGPHTTGPPPPVPPPKNPGSPQSFAAPSPYGYPPTPDMYSAYPMAQPTGLSSSSSSSGTASSSKPYPATSFQPVQPPPQVLPGQPPMAAISFSQENRIRLVNVPTSVLPALRVAIQTGWERPVKSERMYHGEHELTVSGEPWEDLFGDKYVRSRRMLTHLIGAMVVQGWELIHSFNTTRKSDGKDTLFFESVAGINRLPDTQVDLVTVGFRSDDRILLMDHLQLAPVIRQCLEFYWPRGIQAEKVTHHGAHEFKLVGAPFDPMLGETSIQNRRMMMGLMTCLRPHGYKLYTTISVDDTTREIMDTWIFRRMSPVWS